jgi:N-acyl-D-amino-acid deacylase
MRHALVRVAGWSAAVACLLAFVHEPLTAQRAASAPPADLVIAGGTLVDGSGGKARRADVAIREGRIVAVGRLARMPARERLDATGLVVAPGFVDVHTHADRIAEKPEAENFARMGVTTIVAGNCGASALDVGTALADIARTGAAINFATLVGHNTVRAAVMERARRAPTADELDRMKTYVQQAMDAGAVGFSTGLEYVPGAYASTDEIIALATVAGAAGGLYASHMRDEGANVEQAIAETIAVGEAAQCPVEISHLKIDSPRYWGGAARLVALIDKARARGIRVRADQYAYTAASTGLGIRFPSWALEGGQPAIVARLDDEVSWGKIKSEMAAMLERSGARDLSRAVVASYTPDPARNGLSIADIAEKTRGARTLDAQLETAREMLRAGGAQMVYHMMSDADVARIMKHPQVSVASDASINTPGEGRPHPRGYGNTARVLAKYVRRDKVLTLEQAVRKMSALPAEHFGFAGRGVVKAGYAADLVLFDPLRVEDRATFEAPHAWPGGMPHVLVNGVFIVRDGRPTSARPGQVLRRQARTGRSAPTASGDVRQPRS